MTWEPPEDRFYFSIRFGINILFKKVGKRVLG